MSRVCTSLSLLLLLLGVSCSAAREAHESVRLVSLSLALSRVLVGIGAAEEVVGVDPDSRQLPELRHVAPVPDSGDRLRAVLKLEPTLVFAVGGVEKEAFLAALRASGLQVHEVHAADLDELMLRYVEIGRAVGREGAGRAHARFVGRALARLSAASHGRTRPRVAWLVGRKPLVVVGGGSPLHDLIEIAGGENPFELPAVSFRELSPEELVEARPELVLDGTGAARGDRPSFESVPPALSRLPVLDPLERARKLHALIHSALDRTPIRLNQIFE